jgi:hypothetical protein
MAYNFQTGNNKIILLAEYESVTQEVLLFIESILHNAKQYAQFNFFFRFENDRPRKPLQ